MNRVLLTGAGGYIGRNMPDDLVRRGFEVHAVSRAGGTNSDKVTWHNTDLLDTGATDRLLTDISATHLMHLAWITEPGEYWESPQNDEWLRASTALLDRFQKHGGERALLAGTCAEYDWSDSDHNGHCVEDSTPLRAKSRYAKTKLAFREKALEIAAASTLEVAWARVFFSFGPNERRERLVPAVILALLAGERARCSDGSLVRDFMYVPDVAGAMVATLNSAFAGDINIASGEALRLDEFVDRVACKLDGADRVDFGHFPRRPDDPQTISADISRLSDAVGWTPKYDLDSAIDETITWWRNQA